MDIKFDSNHLCVLCNKYAKTCKKLGNRRATLLFQRLNEMKAADCVHTLYELPHLRLHKLDGDLKGNWAVKLDAAFRIVFRPYCDDDIRYLLREDGSPNLHTVNCILIVGVEDYHD